MTTDTHWTEIMPLLEQAVAPFEKAAMFELRDRGYGSLYHQLMACLISVRTLDEVSLPAALRLFEQVPDWETMARMEMPAVADLIEPAQFAGQKAGTMIAMAKTVLEEYGGNLPANYETLTSLKGVGPKCANLTLGVATGTPAISVDTHVFRVVNRLGVVRSTTAEATVAQLEAWVPRAHWIDVNRLLMPFGKHICVFRRPKCEVCPLRPYCEYYQVVVAKGKIQ